MEEKRESPDSTPLALPEPTPDANELPEDRTAPQSIKIDGAIVPLDHLGPMIVNTDGVHYLRLYQLCSELLIATKTQTLSRITNWLSMTEEERSRTLRVLVKRNR
jgi:hypothetical protein